MPNAPSSRNTAKTLNENGNRGIAKQQDSQGQDLVDSDIDDVVPAESRDDTVAEDFVDDDNGKGLLMKRLHKGNVELVHSPRSSRRMMKAMVGNIHQPNKTILLSRSNDAISDDGSEFDVDIETCSSTKDGSNPNMGRKMADEEKLAQNETRAVFHLRVLVILVLFLAAAAVSAVVFVVTRNGETDEFQSQYTGASQKVIETYVHENLLKYLCCFSANYVLTY